MARCNFCRRTFQNAQVVRAHLRHCAAYQGDVEGPEDIGGSVGKSRSVPKALPKLG